MVERYKVDYNDSTPFDGSKLQDLQTIGKAIRHKIYGQDVREPIAQLPDAIIKALQDGTNLGLTGALAELVAARGSFETLGIHETAQDNTIQTAEASAINANQKSSDAIDMIKKIASGAPRGTFANLAALKAKYPSGAEGIYITKDNNHWHYYLSGWTDGGTWQPGEVADGTVKFNALDAQAKIYLSSQFNYQKSALQNGFFSYLPFIFEVGGIETASGNDMDTDTQSARSGLISGDSKDWTFFNSAPSVYKYKLFSYNKNGTFNKQEFGWRPNATSTFTSDKNFNYRVSVHTIDNSNISLTGASDSIHVASLVDKAPYDPMNLWGNFDYMINIGGGGKPSFEKTETNYQIKITLPNYNLFFFDNLQTGFRQKSPDDCKGKPFTLDDNQVLVWDLDNNVLDVIAVNQVRPSHNVLLASNIRGQINNGYFAQFWRDSNLNVNLKQFNQYTTTKGYSKSAVEKYRKLNDDYSAKAQGITFIGDDLLIANSSKGDHSNSSTMYLVDQDFNQLKRIVHNIGHFNTIDYNEKYDTLITGNASDDLEKPKIYLIKDFSKIADGATIDYQDDNVVEIDLFNDATQAFEANIGVCFGETDYFAYASIADPASYNSIGKMGNIGFAKIMLGIGNNDLSKSSNGWGTFASGQTGYNGTVKVIETYSGENLGVNQDMTYFYGHLWGTFNRYNSQFYKISLNSGGTYTLEDSWLLPNYDETTGDLIQKEAEGAAIWKGTYYLVSYMGAITAVPIQGKQIGTGKVDQKVEFDFKLEQTPHVSITSTSATTDLYIDSIDKTGFTIKSASNNTGTFNWESNI